MFMLKIYVHFAQNVVPIHVSYLSYYICKMSLFIIIKFYKTDLLKMIATFWGGVEVAWSYTS